MENSKNIYPVSKESNIHLVDLIAYPLLNDEDQNFLEDEYDWYNSDHDLAVK